jgi:hypothetical protein
MKPSLSLFILLFAGPAFAGSLKTDFLDAVGHFEGEYKLVNGEGSCLDGHVDVVKLHDDKGDFLSIRVRDRAVITYVTLKKRETSSSPGGCRIGRSTYLKGRVVESLETQTCGAQSTSTKSQVTISPGKLQYVVNISVNGKVTHTSSCELAKLP